MLDMNETVDPGAGPLSIAVIGASGDLAMRKIFPALFALYCQKLLPERCKIIGYARSVFPVEAFRDKIMEHLTCRYVPGEKCDELMREFLDCCFYVSGAYDDPEALNLLAAALQHDGSAVPENRIYYMSIPPFLFLKTGQAFESAGLTTVRPNDAWTRVVIEKPFGSDRASSDALTQGMSQVFSEDQTYRIDHYLGKEVIQNLLVLRFANLIFDPIWNRANIDHVLISWSEDLGLEGRAGYFDQYGIIRDVMQNHLLQILALVAMEEPVRLEAHHIRDEKVKTLRSIPPLTLKDIVVGQYAAGMRQDRPHPGYLEEPGIPAGSITPTYAAAVLHVRNRRWDGVPFLIRAGKGMHGSSSEIRICFRSAPGGLFAAPAGHLGPNELVIRIQPDAHILFRIINKVPGLNISLTESNLDLQYESAFPVLIPDAYECLLLDVIEGDRSLFIRADELAAAWDIFTPVLHDLESCTIQPQPYPFGSRGPASADALAALYGASWD